jgi:outer membrane immunogenic protein
MIKHTGKGTLPIMVKLLSGVAGANLLLSGVVMAADIPTKAPQRYAPVAMYNWTGFYIGAHVGFDSGRTTLSDPTAPGSVGITTKGMLGGGQIGYNQQIGAWVFGLEADVSGSDIDGSVTGPDGAGDIIRSTMRVRWTSLLTGRLGYANGPWLTYLKGGAAFGGTRFSGVDFTNGTTINANINRSGWTVGGGVEYAIHGPWSIRAQYDYVDFGTKSVTLVDNTGAAAQGRIKQNIHQAKFGVNYRFGR